MTQIIAGNMRRVRETRGKALLDVADAARDLGVAWSTGVVSRIESGRRELTLEEFLALPLVLTLAVNQPVTLVDLLGTDEDEPYVGSYGRAGHITDVQALLAEPGVLALRISMIPDHVRDTLDRTKRRAQITRALPEAGADPSTESEATAAKLGITPPELAKACEALWDQPTVQAECEHRLMASGADLSHAPKTRLLADHITRALMTELTDYLHTA